MWIGEQPETTAATAAAVGATFVSHLVCAERWCACVPGLSRARCRGVRARLAEVDLGQEPGAGGVVRALARRQVRRVGLQGPLAACQGQGSGSG